MLASHRRYRESEYHEGHRADFSSVDLTGRDFSGLNLRGVKMDHAVLRGADFSGANLRGGNLIGAIGQQACFDRADLSRARLSGANLVSTSFENARLAGVEMEFALMTNAILRGACLGEGPTCARLTCAVPDFAVRSSTRLICGMRDSAVLSWPQPHYGVPICAARIYAWQSSTAPTCPMQIWKAPKA